jgi:eukaryotic-like serine/threonine-protein kinase
LAALVVLAASGFGIYKYHARSVLPANGRALLYVAAFTNSTDDSALDDVPAYIVANELDRSPAVRVAYDYEAQAQFLQSIGRSADEQFTAEFARQMCRRDKGNLFTDGEIKPQGDGYVLDLSVRDCGSGRTVVQQHSEAASKGDVMRAASQLAATVRQQLSGASASSSGSSPASLPTASLPAFQAYLMGERLYETQVKQSAAMLRRAVELDPDFVDAWWELSLADNNQHEIQRSAEDLKHAFALRAKLPENDRAGVEARYYLEVTGETYRAIEALQTWERLAPNEFPPHNLLGLAYADLGDYEKAVTEFKRNTDLFPGSAHAIGNLSAALQAQGRYDEVEKLLRQIPADQAVGYYEHRSRYYIAMLRLDQATMEREQSWMGQDSDESVAVGFLVSIDVNHGQMKKAVERAEHGVNVSVGSGLSEAAAEMLLGVARGEVLYGEGPAGAQTLSQAMRLSDSKGVKESAASLMLLNGQEHEAEKIINDLLHQYPADTFLNELDTPLALAASQLSRGQADATLHTLDQVKPFEFGVKAGYVPNYIRAMAYLRLHRAEDAAGEFSAIVVHRGVDPLNPILVASQLGLARACAMQKDIAKSRAAYETLFSGWKNADPDLPIYTQAKAEYAKLGSQ